MEEVEQALVSAADVRQRSSGSLFCVRWSARLGRASAASAQHDAYDCSHLLSLAWTIDAQACRAADGAVAVADGAHCRHAVF